MRKEKILSNVVLTSGFSDKFWPSDIAGELNQATSRPTVVKQVDKNTSVAHHLKGLSSRDNVSAINQAYEIAEERESSDFWKELSSKFPISMLIVTSDLAGEPLPEPSTPIFVIKSSSGSRLSTGWQPSKDSLGPNPFKSIPTDALG